MNRRSFRPQYWALAQLGSRVRYIPSVARVLTTARLPAPTALSIPTRHGNVRAVVIRAKEDVGQKAGGMPPLLIQSHGGGFLNRYPEQDTHIARYLADNLGAVVVLPDYSTAPKARYPVAEEQMLDVADWLRAAGRTHGWDGDRILLSGVSAGAKLAINVCQQLHAQGSPLPRAVALTVPVTDSSRTDRTSSIRRPAISPFVQRLVAWAYFPDVDRRREYLASPRFDPDLAAAMPPTLIQTAENDTLAAEGAELAHVLQAAGVTTSFHSYPHADHGFYSVEPVELVEQWLKKIVGFLPQHLAG